MLFLIYFITFKLVDFVIELEPFFYQFIFLDNFLITHCLLILCCFSFFFFTYRWWNGADNLENDKRQGLFVCLFSSIFYIIIFASFCFGFNLFGIKAALQSGIEWLVVMGIFIFLVVTAYISLFGFGYQVFWFGYIESWCYWW